MLIPKKNFYIFAPETKPIKKKSKGSGIERMLNKIITILFFAVIVITSLIFFPIALLIWAFTRPFDRRLRFLHQFTCFWGAFYTYIMPAWPVLIEGREKIKGDLTRIFISNHQSQLDILILFRLYTHFKWVSKSEIFRIPLIGWNMVLNRYIKLKRGDRKSIGKMMVDATEKLKEGSSVFIFPEGSRSADGTLKPFKPGAFILAKNLGLSIMPVVIEGTSKALPKYSVNFHGTHPIRVRVLEEIPYESFAQKSVEEIKGEVWHYMKTELDSLKKVMNGK